MVVGDHFLMTDEEAREQRRNALFSHAEAQEQRNRLVLELKTIGKRARRLAELIESVEIAPKNPLQSESALLMLDQGAYAGMDHATVRALSNSIAASRREIAETAEAKRILGYTD
jgi:hypothetical protein